MFVFSNRVMATSTNPHEIYRIMDAVERVPLVIEPASWDYMVYLVTDSSTDKAEAILTFTDGFTQLLGVCSILLARLA